MKQVVADRYELRSMIGQGGGARVYRAYDRRLKVERALKLLIVNEHTDAMHLRKRFEREGQVLARLRHPHILRLYDMEMGEQPFMVVDLCVAGSLRDRVRRGQLPASEAVALVIDVGKALAHAHERGVVHRDVKPANVLIGPEGQALLCDFGIARDLREEARFTMEGSALGTFAYMAPEQRTDSSVVDGAADQYALATTLYTLLCRESPFDLFLAGVDSPRWWGVPRAVVPVLQAAVRVSPMARFPSMRAMVDALEEALPRVDEDVEDVEPLEARSAVVPKLVDWYRNSVGERATALRDALVRWERGDRAAGDEIRRLGHMLKGSGASFGFPVVSEVGALVEDAGDTELGNRASELVYVLRSIAQSKEAPKARVVVYLSRTEHRSTVGLVFPDSVISDDWEHVAAKVRAGDADVLVCEASEVTEQGVVAVRAAGSQVPIVVLDEGRHSAWRARGADRVLAYPPDPVALSATIRGFARAEGAETGIEERAAFLRRLAGEQDALRVEPHTLFALRGPAGAAVGSLVRQSSATELGVRLGRFEGGLLALVPDRVSGPFLAGLPPDTHARCALASVPLGGSEGISRLVTRLIARVGQLGDGERVQLTSAKAAKRVVVVEDDRDVAELVEQVVAGGGHTVEHHVDGAAALQALLASPPDLVVLDIDLPSLDGLAILERLRRHDETADVPVLMLTAHDGESDVVEALELGASDHVAKPFEVGVLNARIRRLLR